jgi:hypothetical protein
MATTYRLVHQSELYAGCVGSKDGCGVVVYARLSKPLTSATLQYKVRFSENYSWTAGGKLPGLCPEREHPYVLQRICVAIS